MTRPPLLLRAWWRLLEAAHVRSYGPGDSTLRYVVTEPWDAAYTYAGRFACRVLHRHNASCRGRRDHLPDHAPGPTGCGRWGRPWRSS